METLNKLINFFQTDNIDKINYMLFYDDFKNIIMVENPHKYKFDIKKLNLLCNRGNDMKLVDIETIQKITKNGYGSEIDEKYIFEKIEILKNEIKIIK